MHALRNITLVLFISTMTFTVFYGQSQTDSEEKEAIVEAIVEGSKAWSKRDYDAWEDIWLQDASATHFVANRNYHHVLLGWEEIDAAIGGSIQSNPEPRPDQVMKNFEVHIHGNVATVSMDVFSSVESFEANDMPSKELRTLIKKNGDWKIMQIIGTNPRSYTLPFVVNSMWRDAQLLFENGEWEKATKLLRLNTELHPESADAWAYLGLAYSEADDKDEAIKHFEHALELDSDHAMAIERLNALRE